MLRQSDVLEQEKAFFAALIEAREDKLDALLVDDFSLADLGGGLMSKAALMQAVGSGQLRFGTIQPIETVVRFYGPTAIVTGQTEMSGHFGDAPFSARSRYTHVYVVQDGELRLAAAQGTPIPPGI